MVNCDKKILGNSSIALKQIWNQKHKLQNRVESTRDHQLNSTFRWPGKSNLNMRLSQSYQSVHCPGHRALSFLCVQWVVAPVYVRSQVPSPLIGYQKTLHYLPENCLRYFWHKFKNFIFNSQFFDISIILNICKFFPDIPIMYDSLNPISNRIKSN